MKHSIVVKATGEQFSCTESQHLLQGMQTFRVGKPLLQVINVGCRGGGCGVCRVRILDGEFETTKMSRKHISLEQQEQGLALACRVYPRSDLSIEVLPIEED